MPRAVLLALISAAICPAQPPSTTQLKGSIAGSVTNVAGEPVKGATLRLTVRQRPTIAGVELELVPPQAYSVASDAIGNFTFDDLDAGRYSVCSDKAGYLSACYDNSKDGTLDLTSGQKLTGITIKMTPQAVISGRVTDEYGDPYPNVPVSVARWGYQNGQKRLQRLRDAASNVEGVFAIGSLEAGSYYLRAEPRNAAPGAIQKGPEEAYVGRFYPGVTDPSSAVAVQVPAGGAVRDIEIRMRKARVYRVRGKLAGLPAGATPPNLILVPKDGPNLNPTSSVVRDGAFDVEGVLPGVYILQVQLRSPASGAARQIVTVGNADVDDLVVQARPGRGDHGNNLN